MAHPLARLLRCSTPAKRRLDDRPVMSSKTLSTKVDNNVRNRIISKIEIHCADWSLTGSIQRSGIRVGLSISPKWPSTLQFIINELSQFAFLVD